MRVHISLNVSAIDKSLAFYSALFGHKPSKLKPGYANFRLDEPPVHLALIEKAETGSQGVSHLGIELPDAMVLAEWRSRLESQGTNFLVEDEAQCCYAQADKLWLSDPDGYRWEVWVRTGEYEAMGETRVDIMEAGSIEKPCCA